MAAKWTSNDGAAADGTIFAARPERYTGANLD
jgi:hypothetical protein